MKIIIVIKRKLLLLLYTCSCIHLDPCLYHQYWREWR